MAAASRITLRFMRATAPRQLRRSRRRSAGGLLGCLGGADLGELLLHLPREHVLRGALALERNLRRHLPLGARAPQRDLDGGERRGEHRLGGGRLVAAVRHAVRALFIRAGAVGVPVGGLHQLLEGFRITFAEQIARLLPAEDVACRHAPGGAVIGLVAGEEIEEQRRVDELPTLTAAEREDLAEELLGLAAVEEVLLV